MKILQIFLICLITLPLFAQKSEKQMKFENYINVFEDYSGYDYTSFSQLETKSFNKLMSLAYETYEVASSELIHLMRSNKSFQSLHSDFTRNIAARYSTFLRDIIRIPIFVKAKIISRKEVNKGGFRQLNLMLEPELVLKGKEPFLEEKQFEVYYREYDYVPDSLDFKIGESYLFPLWDRCEPENEIFAVATFIDEIGGRFLIKDGYIYDRKEYFRQGNKVDWNIFVLEFQKMVGRILYGSELETYKNLNLEDKK